MADAARARAERDEFQCTEQSFGCYVTSSVNINAPTVFETDYPFRMVDGDETLGPASSTRAYPSANKVSCDAMQEAVCDYVIDVMLAFDSPGDYHGMLRLIALVHPMSDMDRQACKRVVKVHVYRKHRSL